MANEDSDKETPAGLPPATVETGETPLGSLNRPPAKPGKFVGPFLNFVTTVPETRTWLGSMLLLHRKSMERPEVELTGTVDARVESWECLDEDIFGMSAWRVNIEVQLKDGVGNDEVRYAVNWHERQDSGHWTVPRWGQSWRIGFQSCNGFDQTVPKETKANLTYHNVWDHLYSVHALTPLHVLLWGGDQCYVDFIFQDVPILKDWTTFEWDKKWAFEFSDELRQQVLEYHFNMYCENFDKRPEVKRALGSIPSVMQWDDHDIFDGAGSYPPLLHDSPVMTGLFDCAQKFRLLFQLHTNHELCRKHRYFGYKGHSSLIQCGPNLALLSSDGRTERDEKTVTDSRSWDMTFDRLNGLPSTVSQLLIIFAVPFSFVRFQKVEKLFDFVNKLPNKIRMLPGLKGQMSLFSLPELYDDLLDHWAHEHHIEERTMILHRLQEVARTKSLRITFLSGDVHCCGLSRFRSPQHHIHRKPVNDPNLMYQVISSAIVNMPPPRLALICYHYLTTKWRTTGDTEEKLLKIFERMPEGGRKLRHRKFLPNRNWCFLEQCADENNKATAFFQEMYAFDKKHGYPSTLGPVSSAAGIGSEPRPIHHHSHGPFCRHRYSKKFSKEKQGLFQDIIKKEFDDQKDSPTGRDLKIRLWLESSKKMPEGRQFASYETIVPHLVAEQEEKHKHHLPFHHRREAEKETDGQGEVPAESGTKQATPPPPKEESTLPESSKTQPSEAATHVE